MKKAELIEENEKLRGMLESKGGNDGVEATVDAFMEGYDAECVREFGRGHVNGQEILKRRLTEMLSK